MLGILGNKGSISSGKGLFNEGSIIPPPKGPLSPIILGYYPNKLLLGPTKLPCVPDGP